MAAAGVGVTAPAPRRAGPGLTVLALLAAAGTPAAAAGPGWVRDAGERFALHSHEGINLHHFLYQWAVHDVAEAAGRRPPVPVSERRGVADLPPDAAAAWNAALSFYREHLADRNLLFDEVMWRGSSRLATARALDDLDDGGLPRGWAGVLRAARPVYAAHWWPGHDAANRAWIERAATAFEAVEGRVASPLAEVYAGAWPDEPVRVDVSYYANRVGAYTGNDPARITIASSDPDQDGRGAVESLLHEVSHADPVSGTYRRELVAACEAAGVEPGREIWHALIFYTAGELTRLALADDDVPYRHYAERVGLLARSPGTARAYAALETTWPALRAAGHDREARARALGQYVEAFAATSDADG